ncbi:hypothetical protein GCM10020001_064810 [Nonomuraea salmonea]
MRSARTLAPFAPRSTMTSRSGGERGLDQVQLVLAEEEQVGGAGQLAEHLFRLAYGRPQLGDVLDGEGDHHPGVARRVDGRAHGFERVPAQSGGDAGHVHHLRGADPVDRDVARREQRARRARAVVGDACRPGHAGVAEQHPRTRAGHHPRVGDVHALAPQHGQRPGAQLVLADLAQVGAVVAEPGECDGEGELGTADVQPGLALMADSAAGDDAQWLSQGVDVRHGARA